MGRDHASVEIVAKFTNQLPCSNSTVKAFPGTGELRQEDLPCTDEDLSLDPRFPRHALGGRDRWIPRAH